MDELSAQRLAAAEARPSTASPAISMAMLAAFVEPALAMSQDRHGGGAFVRVVARAYAEKNDGLRKFLSDNYGHVLREFAQAPSPPACPALSKEELYWRLDFLAGALTYAMADFGLIKRPPASPKRRTASARRPRTDPLRRGRLRGRRACSPALPDLPFIAFTNRDQQGYSPCLSPPLSPARPPCSVPASWARRSPPI
ncbi:MAG: hypothetical protein U5L46_13770 [Agrobacterium sp.]|nr:hypothetical protein [Agrobacterium sp.]